MGGELAYVFYRLFIFGFQFPVPLFPRCLDGIAQAGAYKHGILKSGNLFKTRDYLRPGPERIKGAPIQVGVPVVKPEIVIPREVFFQKL